MRDRGYPVSRIPNLPTRHLPLNTFARVILPTVDTAHAAKDAWVRTLEFFKENLQGKAGA